MLLPEQGQRSSNYSAIESQDVGESETAVQNDESLLSSKWRIVLPLALFVYFALIIAVGGLGKNLCNDPYEFPDWVLLVNIFVVVWFAVFSLFLIMRMADPSYRQPEVFAALASNLTITVIAGSSAFLTLTMRWGGLCRDCFGVLSPALQWPEWVTSVPLLIFFAISCDTDRVGSGVAARVDATEISVVCLAVLMIASGFLLTLPIRRTAAFISMGISCASFVGMLSCSSRAQRELQLMLLSTKEIAHGVYRLDRVASAEKWRFIQSKRERLLSLMRKKSLSLLCLVGMPLFPIIYFLSFFKLIDDDISYSSFLLAGMLVKSILAIILSTKRLTIFEDLQFTVQLNKLEQRIEEIEKFQFFAENQFYKTKFENQARVLIVEDSPTVMKMLSRLLRSKGFLIEVAEDGLIALTKMKNREYDWVMLDIGLPKLTGIEVVQQFREFEKSCSRRWSRHQYIIGISAEAITRASALAAGMDAFLQKPLTEKMIEDVMRRHPHPRMSGLNIVAPIAESSAVISGDSFE